MSLRVRRQHSWPVTTPFWMAITRHAMFLSFLGCAAFFLFFPALDIGVSRLFYETQAGFLWQNYPLIQWIYHGVPWAAMVLVAILVLLWLYSFVAKNKHWLIDRRNAGYLLLALLLGPGLLVNVVLKDHWGRARPCQVQPFGGTQQFTPALLPTDQCMRNCSFVSGHASFGFYLVAFGFLREQNRRRWLLIGLMAGGLIGLARIVQGGHFLSDVVFSFFSVYTVAWLLHFYLQKEQPS